jgi:hypothetical protein
LIEVLQEGTKRVVAIVSQFDLKNEAAFWLGLVGTVLATVLTAIKIWESWSRRLDVDLTTVATDKRTTIRLTLRVRNKGRPTSMEDAYIEWSALTQYRSGTMKRRTPLVNRRPLRMVEIQTGDNHLVDLEPKKEKLSLPFRIRAGTTLFQASFDPRLQKFTVYGHEVKSSGPQLVVETTNKRYVKILDPSLFRLLDVKEWSTMQ